MFNFVIKILRNETHKFFIGDFKIDRLFLNQGLVVNSQISISFRLRKHEV